MKLLTLNLFAGPKGDPDRNPFYARGRIQWVIDLLNQALDNKNCKVSRDFHDTGFVAVNLWGPDQKLEHTQIFDHGYCAVVCPDGQSVELTEKAPLENAQDCLQWLDALDRFCDWAHKVLLARANNERPPALDPRLNHPEFCAWVGQEAVQYVEDWKSNRLRQSSQALKHDPEFVKELQQNVRNILGMTQSAKPRG